MSVDRLHLLDLKQLLLETKGQSLFSDIYLIFQSFLFQDEVFEFEERLTDGENHAGSVASRHFLETAVLDTRRIVCAHSLPIKDKFENG